MPESGAGPDGDILVSVFDIERAIQSLVLVWSRAEDAAHTQISPAQLRALMAVARRGSLNLSQLADELGTVASWASRLCDRLVAAAYLDRQTSNQSHREVVVTLRCEGQQLLADLEGRRRSALAGVLANMSATDRRLLVRGLEAFARAADHTLQKHEQSAC